MTTVVTMMKMKIPMRNIHIVAKTRKISDFGNNKGNIMMIMINSN